MAKSVVVLTVEFSYVQGSTLGYYCMHILKLLHSRCLLNHLQLFRNTKVSVRTNQDIAPTLLMQQLSLTVPRFCTLAICI